MNAALAIALQALAYAVVVVGGVGGFCAVHVFNCRFNTDVLVEEAIVPILVVGLAICLVGLVVAALNAMTISYLSKEGRTPSTGSVVVIGMTAGILPRVVWEVFSGRFPDTFFPHIDYVPFLVGGLVVALMATRFRRPRAV